VELSDAFSTSNSLLIVFGGLPGTGKTSIARQLAMRMAAVYLRIDTIEQALRASPGVSQPVNEEGYRAAYRLAEENLRLGRNVISDSVNPIQASRDAWVDIGYRTNSRVIEVEVVCTDIETHRRRVETREPDIPGLKLSTWEKILARAYEPWSRNRIVIDTARKTILECVAELESAIASCLDPSSVRPIL
jgi:predicted kinase